jgi:hypothetical protein
MSDADNNYEMENLRFESENSAHADIRFANFTEVKMWLYLTKCTLENCWFEPKGAVEEAVKVLGEDGEVAGEIVRLQNKNLGRLIPPQGNWDMNPCVDCGEPFSCCDYPVPPYPIFGFGGEYIGEKATIRLCRFCEQIRKRERQAQLDKDFAEGQNSGISKYMKQCENERDPDGSIRQREERERQNRQIAADETSKRYLRHLAEKHKKNWAEFKMRARGEQP